MEKPSITTLQAVFMLSGSTGLLNHVLIIPMILQEVGRDSWVSVLVSAGVALLWIPVLYLIVKKTSQQHLLDWIGQRYGRFVAKLLAVLFVTYMMFVSVVTFKDTLNWTNTSYLPQTPQVVLIVLFAAICFYNAFSGIESIAMTASVLIPIVIVLGFFVMTGNFSEKDYSMVRPVLEHGFAPVWKGILYSGAGFGEIMYLILFQHHLRSKIRIGTLLLLVVIFLGLTLGPLLGAIAEFGHFAAADLRYPAYEEWRLLFIGRYVEHLDFLSIYQWLTGAFLRISLSMHLIPELLEIKGRKRRRYWSLGAFLVLCVLTRWPISDMTFLRLLTQTGIPAATIFLWSLSLIVGILVLFRGKQKVV